MCSCKQAAAGSTGLTEADHPICTVSTDHTLVTWAVGPGTRGWLPMSDMAQPAGSLTQVVLAGVDSTVLEVSIPGILFKCDRRQKAGANARIRADFNRIK